MPLCQQIHREAGVSKQHTECARISTGSWSTQDGLLYTQRVKLLQKPRTSTVQPYGGPTEIYERQKQHCVLVSFMLLARWACGR